MDRLWKVNNTTAITCRKHVKNMYLCTHATQHTPHGPHTVFIFSLPSSLVFPFSVLFLRVVLCCVVVCCVVLCCVVCVVLCCVVLCCVVLCCVVLCCVVLCCVVLCCVVCGCPREVHQRNRWILPISSLRTTPASMNKTTRRNSH